MARKLPGGKKLARAEAALGVTFGDRALLRTAVTHQSFLNENPGLEIESNERLEFLGDGVLNFIIARWLYESLPGRPEGDLTARRAQAVRGETLARVAARMKLGDHLIMGRGEEASGGAKRRSNLANGFEAIVGAILMDSGIRAATAFVKKWLGPDMKSIIAAKTPKDPKSMLQELLQGRGQKAPRYRLVKSEGPDDDRVFTSEVLVEGEPAGQGTGRRKIEAERAAAVEAYARAAETGV